eukprot:COSAG06_NODE_33152_length_494_cov_1.156962_1_plen_110_part_10
MSYHLGLGERAKERVDTYAHVVLTDEEAKKLLVTKALCTITCVVGTLWLVSNGAVVAALMSGFFTVLIFKLSHRHPEGSRRNGRRNLNVASANPQQRAVLARAAALHCAA